MYCIVFSFVRAVGTTTTGERQDRQSRPEISGQICREPVGKLAGPAESEDVATGHLVDGDAQPLPHHTPLELQRE
jgi:hypothetical protein